MSNSIAYYNERDPFAAAWLVELIKEGVIADGVVDDRDIQDVRADELAGYTQCHFFAGIGGWSYALRLAGWPDDRPVWTGSCPCQPFSTAGKRGGQSDERHLWPVWFNLIRECRPSVVFGEQVASSLVVGSGTEVDDLYQVLGRKAIFDVLLQPEGILPECLQELRECSAQQTQTCELCGRSLAGTRENTRIGSAIQSEQVQSSIQSGSHRYSSDNCSGILRTDGNRVRSEDAKSMECSVTGSDKTGSGIYEGERSSGLICSECHGSQLGAFVNPEDSGCDSESYKNCIGRLVEETGRGFEKEPSTWLSTVQSDLAGIGYSFGASVLTAAGVGAPHRRQRLYFVADATFSGSRALNGKSRESIRQEMSAGGRGVPDFGAAQSNGHECGQKRADGRGIGEGSRTQGMEQRSVRGGNEFVAHAERSPAESGWLAIESREGDGTPGAGTSVEFGRCCDTCGHPVGAHCDIKWKASGCQVDGCSCEWTGDLAYAPDLRRIERRDAAPTPLQGERPERSGEHKETGHAGELPGRLKGLCGAGNESVDNSPGPRRDAPFGGTESETWDETRMRGFERGRADDDLAYATGPDSGTERLQRSGVERLREESGDGDGVAGASERAEESFWSSALWLPCRDSKLRPVEPTIFPLAHGIPNRVGQLRGAGNAIVPQAAAEFIAAYLETIESEMTASDL